MDTAYAEFLSIFSEQYNICCPVKTVRAQVARRDKPLITNDLKNARRKKNRLYKIWLYSKLLSDAKGNSKDTWTLLIAAMKKKELY